MAENVAVAHQLTKTYPLGHQNVEALKGIDLELKRGDFALLFGPSGAGKTTMLNLLGCLDRPTGGELTVAGEAVYTGGKALREDQLDRMRREHIGLVFTEFFLLPTLTAAQNVCLPMLWQGQVDPDKAEALLLAVGLGHRLTHRPSELSGGEMQRVAIARSLVNDPDLLLADEPTGNLDTETRDEILDVLRQINAERRLTVLLASHDTELVDRVPRLIRLEDGRLLEGDSHVN